MNGDEIRAYVLFGIILAIYPVLLGVKAVKKAYITPEIVYFHQCKYEIRDNGYGTLEPVAVDKTCPVRTDVYKDEHNGSGCEYTSINGTTALVPGSCAKKQRKRETGYLDPKTNDLQGHGGVDI